MPDLVVDWVPGLTQVGWTFNKGTGARTIPISRLAYLQAPSHLEQWRAISRFQRIAASKPFHDWWLQECGGDPRTLKRFMLRFPAGAWDVPWELLVAELDRERRPSVSLVRGLTGEPVRLPSQFDRPMSIVMVKGDDGSKSGWNWLDLNREGELLLAAYEALPETHRAILSRPRVLQPTAVELQALFQDERNVPDVIFLSGHGLNKPSAFILADGSYLTPQSFAVMISTTAVRPMFVVFWACDTAREENDTRKSPGPPFFSALLGAGISSVLAMQAPINDAAALLLAQELFQSLAAGDALDVASARARATLLDAVETGVEGVRPIDCACPVVWTSGLSAARLGWRSPTTQLAQMQTVSRRVRLDRDARAFFPPTELEIAEARRIGQSRLSWIKIEKLAEHRERWLRLLLALQTVHPRYCVSIDLADDTSIEDGLRDWAEELQQLLEPSDATVDLRNALELTRRRPVEGWQRLCSFADTIVAVWNPPVYSAGDWFWEPLAQMPGPTVVAATFADNAVVSTGWAMEDMAMQYNQTELDQARAQSPALSHALALLDGAVPKASIQATGVSTDLPQALRSLVISTTANEIVLAAPAAKYFRDTMSQAERQAGHRDCMLILAHPSFAGRLTPAVREQRLHHCLEAAEFGAAAEEATALLAKYRTLDRQRAALGVMRRLGSHWRDLAPRMLIIPAWAHAMLGEMEQADFWLSRSEADDVFDQAWQFGLRAEIDKAHGDRDAALKDIDNAIGVFQTLPNSGRTELIKRRLRAYRQDRARILQYLYYDRAAAGAEYEQLLAEWQNDEDAALDVTIVLRNFSECVRSGCHPGDSGWQRSKDMLAQATGLLANDKDHPVFAEVEYEKARVAYAEHAADERALLLSAKEAAIRSGHLMLLAIIIARLFWHFEPFDSKRWTDVDIGLSAFPRHGWAVRTLIDGRLRAAKRMGSAAEGLSLIDASARLLDENPAFNAGSDRFRIAATAAGHEVLSGGTGGDPRWLQFLELPWSTAWLDNNGMHNAADIWERVT